MNSTMKTLLRFSKENLNGELITWLDVSKALHPDYFELSLQDLMIVLLREYGELMNEPRFKLGNADMASRNLLLAPIKGHFAVEFLGPRSLDAKYSVEQFYNAMVREIISAFRCTTVDWCKNEVWPEEMIPDAWKLDSKEAA